MTAACCRVPTFCSSVVMQRQLKALMSTPWRWLELRSFFRLSRRFLSWIADVWQLHITVNNQMPKQGHRHKVSPFSFLNVAFREKKGEVVFLCGSLIWSFVTHRPLIQFYRLSLSPHPVFTSTASRSKESPSWLPASPRIVCAWERHRGSWCCRTWWEHDQQSVWGEAALKGDARLAGGRLGAADTPAPAGPGGGGPAASAQPPCLQCKQSLA